MGLKEIAFLFLVAVSSATWAARPISLTNDQVLNFGVIAKPTSGNVKVIVNRNGGLGGRTTAIVLNSSDISVGKNTIKGDKRDAIQISLSNCSSNDDMGLRLRSFRASYDGVNFRDSANGLPPPGNKGTELSYGATLVVRSSVLTGHLQPCYDINVDYD